MGPKFWIQKIKVVPKKKIKEDLEIPFTFSLDHLIEIVNS